MWKGWSRLPTVSAARVARTGATPTATATGIRCRVHFPRNALAYANKSQRQMVFALNDTIFAQETTDAAHGQWRIVTDQQRLPTPLPGHNQWRPDSSPEVSGKAGAVHAYANWNAMCKVADQLLRFARRCSLSRINPVRSAAGRISKGPALTPGCSDINSTA